MAIQSVPFFSAVVSAGAILTGFCGSFLAFRIQREANYFRQPALDFATGKAKDVLIGLSHFSHPFLLLIAASLGSLLFGVLLPLFGIAGVSNRLVSPGVTVAGLAASTIVLCGYFYAEMNHYGILRGDLVNDINEKRGAWPILIGTALSAFLAVCIVAWAGLFG
jgi:hypothetical protein